MVVVMKRLVLAAGAAFALVAGLFTVQTAAQAAEWPTVQNGDSGVRVQALQHLLTAAGSGTEVDGSFGPNTEAAVQQFQSENDLEGTGVVDASTWTALTPEVRNGDSGDGVAAAQLLVNQFVGPITVDGEFGPDTEGSVSAFQSAHGLEETGVVDDATWRELTGNDGVAYTLPLPRNSQPREEWDDPHHDYPALDMQVGEGTDVFATQGGTATVLNNGSCGNGVQVTTADGAEYLYCHFSAHSIVSGEVQAGQKIGESGNTGNSTGPHLHVQIRYDGALRCPGPMMFAIYDGTDVPAPAALPTSGCIG